MEPIRITPAEVEERRRKGEELAFIDARSASAWQAATMQIPGSIRVPPDEVAQHLVAIPRDRRIITYCT